MVNHGGTFHPQYMIVLTRYIDPMNVEYRMVDSTKEPCTLRSVECLDSVPHTVTICCINTYDRCL